MEASPSARSPDQVPRPKSAMSRSLIEMSNKKRREKASQGREMHFLVKTRKETESEVFKMRNRVSQLNEEQQRRQRQAEKSRQEENRIKLVRSKHSEFLNYVNTRKQEISEEMKKKEAQVRKEREENNKKLRDSKHNNWQSKRKIRNSIKAESVEYTNILRKHLNIVSNYKKKKAKSISDHEKKLKQQKDSCYKNRTDFMNHEYVTRMEKEILDTINAEQELKDLGKEEHKILSSMKNPPVKARHKSEDLKHLVNFK